MKYLNIFAHLDLAYAYLCMDYKTGNSEDEVVQLAKGIMFNIAATHNRKSMRKPLYDPSYYSYPDASAPKNIRKLPEAIQVYLSHLLDYLIISMKQSHLQFNFITLLLHQFLEGNGYNLFAMKKQLNELSQSHRDYLNQLYLGNPVTDADLAKALIAEIREIAEDNNMEFMKSRLDLCKMMDYKEPFPFRLGKEMLIATSNLFGTLTDEDVEDQFPLPVQTDAYPAYIESWDKVQDDFAMMRNIYYEALRIKGIKGLGDYTSELSPAHMLQSLLLTDLTKRFPDVDFSERVKDTEFAHAKVLRLMHYERACKRVAKEFGPAVLDWVEDAPQQSLASKVKSLTKSFLDV